MAEKPDPFDIAALERSLNDSATRVSTIWVSYLIFALYLLIATGDRGPIGSCFWRSRSNQALMRRIIVGILLAMFLSALEQTTHRTLRRDGIETVRGSRDRHPPGR